MLEIVLIPFVISKNPLINGGKNEVSIFNRLKIGKFKVAKKLIIPVVFKIDIILENIITKPPINKIVDVALVILSAKTSPRFENDIFCFVSETLFELLI